MLEREIDAGSSSGPPPSEPEDEVRVVRRARSRRRDRRASIVGWSVFAAGVVLVGLGLAGLLLR
jgi:hypothetical protein